MSESDEAVESPEDLDDEEWAFTLSDLEDREEAAEQRVKPIEAGDPSLESTIFVLLGVAFTIFIISRLFLG